MGKESASSAGDTGDVGLIHRWRVSPGEGHGNAFQDSYWENQTEEPGRLHSMGSQRVRYD